MNLKGDIIRVNKAKEKEIEQMRQEEKQKQAEELKQKDKGKNGICYDIEVEETNNQFRGALQL